MSSKISEYATGVEGNVYLRLGVMLVCVVLLIYIAVKVSSEFLVSSPGGPYFTGPDYLPDKYLPHVNWPVYTEHLSATSPVSMAEDARLVSLLY